MEEGGVIGGVYEVAIGTTDAAPLLQYWEQFGYHAGEKGELSAENALKLYGVRSKLHSIRLHHQDSDHGLIRIFVWETPVNDGLQLAPMKVVGGRWGATLTSNLLKLENHIEEAQAQHMPLYHVPSVRGEIYPLKTRPAPFLDKYPCVREIALIQPLTRQMIFQRFEYNLPMYGQINESSFFQTSQITNVGIVIEDKAEYLDFYDIVLGLYRSTHDKPGANTFENRLARQIFNLQPGESYADTYFDDPRSEKLERHQRRAGKLKVVRFADITPLENKLAYSRPGSLGYSLYTLRVKWIVRLHQRVRESQATDVTDICANEFGEHSFSFVAPDGYFWTILSNNLPA